MEKFEVRRGAGTALECWRLGLAGLLAVLALGIGGCGGGSDGSAAPVSSGGSVSGGAPGSSIPPGVGTIAVTVVDFLGAPVANARVSLILVASNGDGTMVDVFADARGYAELTNQILSVSDAFAITDEVFGRTDTPTSISATRLEYRVVAYPLAAATGGYTAVSVPANGVGDGGRTLTFSIRLIGILEQGPHYDYYAGFGDFQDPAVDACLPDAGNDHQEFHADCVTGPGAMDSPYQAKVLSYTGEYSRSAPRALALSLLLDQGSSAIVNDPSDRRLFGAKYLMNWITPDDRVVLGAFASDDSQTGQPALLPQQPATLFPVENPQFTANGSDYFAAIDDLAALEGGASPAYAAIDRTVDFAVAHAPAGRQRAVVAVRTGEDTICGTHEACLAAQAALAAKSAANSVDVITVELVDPSARPDPQRSYLFSQDTNGATLWARDPRQLATILGDMPDLLAGRMRVLEVTVRLESTVSGAFTSGRTVLGTAHMQFCPWLCVGTGDIPFAVRVP